MNQNIFYPELYPGLMCSLDLGRKQTNVWKRVIFLLFSFFLFPNKMCIGWLALAGMESNKVISIIIWRQV